MLKFNKSSIVIASSLTDQNSFKISLYLNKIHFHVMLMIITYDKHI